MEVIVVILFFQILLLYSDSLTNGCVCFGDTLTYNCTVMGMRGGSTIWTGSALQECTNNEITFSYNNFIRDDVVCNNGNIVGRTIGVEGSYYTSQLNITLTPGVIGKNVMCVNYDGTSEIIQFSTAINKSAASPPPNNVLVSAVNFYSKALMFSWSPVTSDCLVLHYNILTSNCGSCPTTTTDTTVTCTDVPTNGSMCTFAVQTVVCGDIVGDSSDSVNVTTFLKEDEKDDAVTQVNKSSLSILAAGAVMLCTGVIFILVCLLYKPVKRSIVNPLCNRTPLQNNMQSSVSKEEMALSTYYRRDEASPDHERTLDIRTSGIYGQLDNQGPLTLDNLVNRLHGQLPTTQWFRFGQAIGVPKEVLNSLERYSERDRLVEMLDYWLKHHHGEPTWMEVREAQRKAEYYERTDDPTHYSALNRTSAAFSVSSSAPPKPPRRRSSVNKPNAMCVKDDKQVYDRTSHILPKREGSINL